MRERRERERRESQVICVILSNDKDGPSQKDEAI